MFTPWVRMVFIVLGVLVSLGGLFTAKPWIMLGGVGVFLLTLFDHFRNGTIALAQRAAAKGNYTRAGKLLDYISQENWLSPKNRGAYFLLRGTVAQAAGDTAAALAAYEAVFLGTPHPNDATVARANRAKILLAHNDPDAAWAELEATRSLVHTPELTPIIEALRADVAAARRRD